MREGVGVQSRLAPIPVEVPSVWRRGQGLVEAWRIAPGCTQGGRREVSVGTRTGRGSCMHFPPAAECQGGAEIGHSRAD